MSDKKIIIRNCPAFDSKYNECHSKIEPHKLYCMDCTDCVMKQFFLETYKLADNLDEKITIDTLGINFQKAMETLTKIRKLLDIQEVE